MLLNKPVSIMGLARSFFCGLIFCFLSVWFPIIQDSPFGSPSGQFPRLKPPLVHRDLKTQNLVPIAPKGGRVGQRTLTDEITETCFS